MRLKQHITQITLVIPYNCLWVWKVLQCLLKTLWCLVLWSSYYFKNNYLALSWTTFRIFWLLLSYPMLIYLTFKKWNLIIKATDDSLPFFSLSSVLFLAQCIFCIGRNFCTLASLLYTFKKKKITFTTLLLIPQALCSVVPELAHRNFIQDSLPYLSHLIFGILIQPSQNNLVILY